MKQYNKGGSITAAFLMLIVLLGSCNQEKQQIKKPNVIVILTDDQGWGDLSLNGNLNLATPNIDRLAASGAVFDRFYVSPVCSPTRAEFLTGRYHPRGGVFSTSAGGERLDLDESTIAQAFKDNGYATAAYGKWHNGMQPPYHPNARGFDDFYGFCSGHWGNYFSPMLEHNGEIVSGNGYLTDDLTDHAIRFIENHKKDPFFLYIPFNTPHSPMQVPDEWWNKFEGSSLTMLHRDPEKEDTTFTKAALAMCENIDWNVGRITDHIEKLGLTENTIIIYFSDNGPNSWRWNGGMKGKKGSTDEGGVRSPLIIQWKGSIDAGKKVDQIAAAIDLFPTLTELAALNYSPDKKLDGISLKPLLMEESPTWDERLIFSYWNNNTSVRNQNFRLDSENRLYDMVQDPGQVNPVNATYPEIADQLIKARRNWENEVAAELDPNEERPFTAGHPEFDIYQLPARDATGHGNIIRSNQYPNCSFLTNWISTEDSITWPLEVLQEGDYHVVIWFTCPEADIGSSFSLSFGNSKIHGRITEAHNPPLEGMDNDRVERAESYVKDFKPLQIGTIHLEKGTGLLTLKAEQIPGKQVMDFRLLLLRKV